MMGGKFETIYSSRVGIAWNESADKFKYAMKEIPGESEDDDDEEYFELNHASPDGIEEYGSEIEAHRIAMEDDEDDLDMLEGCAA